MSEFMRAHGYLPGPTQRPLTAGCLTAIAAALLSLPLLTGAGGLEALARSLGQPRALVLAGYLAAMAAAGLLYARLFMRAANDRRGGWLFGMSFGFLLWLLGPVALLQGFLGRPVAMGLASQGIFGAHVGYGLLLGLLFPWIHMWCTPREAQQGRARRDQA